MPNFFEKLQKLKKPQRVAIVFSIIGLLAVLSIIFIAENFQERIKDFNRKEPLLKEFDFPEFEQELNSSFGDFEQSAKDLEQELEKLGELEELEAQIDSTSSATSVE